MKIAINRTVVNKAKPEDFGRITYTFENVSLSPQELADSIDKGFAFCTHHKNGRRLSANFLVSDFLAVDIDHGLTIERALNDPFVESYATIFYTTPSHTNENHRFRLIFALERDISCAVEMKHAYRGIAKKLGGDPACKDACRMFYGSKGSKPKVFDKSMPNDVLEEIITLGKETVRQHDSKTNDRLNSASRSTVRSQKIIDSSLCVQTSDGREVCYADLPASTPIYCPVHIDNNPSAFVTTSKSGIKGIHCSKCDCTYWPTSETPRYNFNYSLANLKEIPTDDTANPDEPLEMEPRDIYWIESRYLDAPIPQEHITFVKSPKGTGKTRWLESVVRECKRSKVAPGTGESETESVLLIGHRRSLIRSASQRLKLTPYLDFFSDTKSLGFSDIEIYNDPTRLYAICVDSLVKQLNPAVHRYDVVIIDEVEQVLSHLTGNTVKEKRRETFLYFKHYLNKAKRLYVLDADLNELTVNALYNLIDDSDKSIKFLVNEWKPKPRALDLYHNKGHVVQELLLSIERGQRCFVATNSKAEAAGLGSTIRQKFNDDKTVLVVTSENSSTSEIQSFIRNIKTEILQYDVVIASPSLGTGIDISFPQGKSHIDHVVGIFESRINTHFDIDQQLARVRNPGRVSVWVSPQAFSFETAEDVIKREVRDTEKSTRVLLRIDDDGTPHYDDEDEYLDLYANVVSMQRGSKNQLLKNFVELRQHTGWTINYVDKDEDLAGAGNEARDEGRQQIEKERIERILSAKLITEFEYKKLKGLDKKISLEEEQQSAMRRYEIESFYRTSLTKELAERDRDGQYRREIRNYETFRGQFSLLSEMDREENQKDVYNVDKRNLTLWRETMLELLKSADLINENDQIRTESIIRSDELRDFIVFCEVNRNRIARLYDVVVRKDLARKPTTQLWEFLNLLGVRHKKLKTIKEEGKKKYLYTIPEESVKELEDMITRRADPMLQLEWQDARNSRKKGRLFNKANPLRFPKTYKTAIRGVPTNVLEVIDVDIPD